MAYQDPYKEIYRYEDTLEQQLAIKSAVSESKVPINDNFEAPVIESTTIIKRRRAGISLTKFAALVTTVAVTATAAFTTGDVGITVSDAQHEYYYDAVSASFAVSNYDESNSNQGFVVALAGEDIRYCSAYYQYTEQPATPDAPQAPDALDEQPTPDFSRFYWSQSNLTLGATYSYDVYHIAAMPFDVQADYQPTQEEYAAVIAEGDKVFSSSFTVPPNYKAEFSYSFAPNLLYDGSMTLNYELVLLSPQGNRVTEAEPADAILTIYLSGDNYSTVNLPAYSTEGEQTVQGEVNSIYISMQIGEQYYTLFEDYEVPYQYVQPTPTATVTLNYDETFTSVTAQTEVTNIDFTASTPTHIVVLQVTGQAQDGEEIFTEVLDSALLGSNVSQLNLIDLAPTLTYAYTVYAAPYDAELQAQLENYDFLYSYDFSAWTVIGVLDNQKIEAQIVTGE